MRYRDTAILVACKIGTLQFIFNHTGECTQNVQLHFLYLTGLVINDAQGAELETTGLPNGDARVETDVGATGYQRVGLEAGVLTGVFNDKCLVLANGIVAERYRAGSFASVNTVFRFEPLALVVDRKSVVQGNRLERGVG